MPLFNFLLFSLFFLLTCNMNKSINVDTHVTIKCKSVVKIETCLYIIISKISNLKSNLSFKVNTILTSCPK